MEKGRKENEQGPLAVALNAATLSLSMLQARINVRRNGRTRNTFTFRAFNCRVLQRFLRAFLPDCVAAYIEYSCPDLRQPWSTFTDDQWAKLSLCSEIRGW